MIDDNYGIHKNPNISEIQYSHGLGGHPGNSMLSLAAGCSPGGQWKQNMVLKVGHRRNRSDI